MAGGGAAQPTDGKKKARIEIIPLIDVVFFLLATFVLFTLSLNKISSLPVNLPVAAPPNPDQVNEDPVVIQVTDGNSVYWNKEAIGMTEVLPRLLQYKGTAKDARVLLSGDDRANFGALVEALDKVRQANIEKVSIETVYRASGR
ncbi:ExbD/TolR family protein [Nibricoccus sp. IMCC34717]|uniref:ExbD/TolR family protein n=1 Tax=Nibricoccus sp. IMCC34717 TaxID=3034021 RepID=UPI00384D4FB9